MSVVVRGMEMPENCLKCPMQFGGFCYVQPEWVDESRVAPTPGEAVIQGRPEWCPLVDLGKHGDLIDRGKLLRDIEKYHVSDGKFQHWTEIQNAVIEAEDG